jgi:hypothetical protein
MSDNTPIVSEDEGGIKGMDAALTKVRADGHDEGYQKGLADGRQLAMEILGCDEAKGRETFARKLAADPDMTLEKAKGYLESSAMEPEEKDKKTTIDLKGYLEESQPRIGADRDDAQAERERRLERLNLIAKSVGGSR